MLKNSNDILTSINVYGRRPDIACPFVREEYGVSLDVGGLEVGGGWKVKPFRLERQL